MPSESNISEDVENLVKDIISKNNWEPVSDIKYEQGAEAGDGYFSKTVAVNITCDKGVFHLFLKCAFNEVSGGAVPIGKMYANEIYFYDVVNPIFRKFVNDRGVDDGFRHVPTCYGTLDSKILALDNLKCKGYSLFDRERAMNENHITMVLKTFAKLHAVSFALKDQDMETFEKLSANLYDPISAAEFEGSPFEKMFKTVLNDFLIKLDPAEDKDILDKCDVDDLVGCLTSPASYSDPYSVYTQGDCWCNNMMFLYEENNTENPTDVMVIDWQVLRLSSAMFDVAFFFYTSASEESLSKLQHYLKTYHEELSRQIRQLGSDPSVLYPLEIMEKEWKQHCKYGFAFAFNHIKVMLASKGEELNFETIDFENMKLYPKFDKEDEYIRRMKLLTRFMIKNDYL